jgi:hypothetical protein
MVGIIEVDRDFHALSDGILSFLVTYLYRKNKFEKYVKRKKKRTFLGISG